MTSFYLQFWCREYVTDLLSLSLVLFQRGPSNLFLLCFQHLHFRKGLKACLLHPTPSICAVLAIVADSDWHKGWWDAVLTQFVALWCAMTDELHGWAWGLRMQQSEGDAFRVFMSFTGGAQNILWLRFFYLIELQNCCSLKPKLHSLQLCLCSHCT